MPRLTWAIMVEEQPDAAHKSDYEFEKLWEFKRMKQPTPSSRGGCMKALEAVADE